VVISHGRSPLPNQNRENINSKIAPAGIEPGNSQLKIAVLAAPGRSSDRYEEATIH
ncbi:jg369, partial [Pararge aegeria aegeria]